MGRTIDCLSHYELKPDPTNVYMSYGGQFTTGKLSVIQKLHRYLSMDKSVQVVIAVDNDDKGTNYTKMLSNVFLYTRINIHAGKDFKDKLKSIQISKFSNLNY